MAAPSRPLHALQASVLWVALLACGPAWSQQPSVGCRAVRNLEPERAVAPERAAWPICYPGPALSAMAVASLEDVLLREFLDLHTAMEYEQADEVAMCLQAIAPDAAIAHYNRACALARLCRVEDALAALRKAIDCGWSDRRHLQLDPDMAILRRNPGFQALLELVPAAAAHPANSPWKPAEAPRAAVALIHRGQVVMQWDDDPGALGAGDLLQIASETWRQREAAAPQALAGGPAVETAAGDVEPLVVFCASPELARELAILVEAAGGRARLSVRTPPTVRPQPQDGTAAPRLDPPTAAPGRAAASEAAAAVPPPPSRSAA